MGRVNGNTWSEMSRVVLSDFFFVISRIKEDKVYFVVFQLT